MPRHLPTLRREVRTVKNISGKICGARATASPDSESSGGWERKREGRPRGSEAEEAVLSRFSFLYSPSLLLLLLLSSGGGGGK